MGSDISFPNFFGLIDKKWLKQENRKKFYSKIYCVFKDDLQFQEFGFTAKKREIDDFLKGRELKLQWNGSGTNQPFNTIIDIGSGRLSGKKACLLLYWLFMEHPDKCEGIAQLLWEVDTLDEHLENENAKSKLRRKKKKSPKTNDKGNTTPSVSERVVINSINRNIPSVSQPKLRDKISSVVSSVLFGYEPSSVEDNFKRFLSDHDRGTWLLTGGPGHGKTAIMASMMSQFSDVYHCIPYIFQQGGEQLPNDVETFYQHIFEELKHQYPNVFLESNEEFVGGRQKFEKILWKLFEQGHVTRKCPLIIIVDALDEILAASSDGNYYTDRLKLPDNIPEGVYFALSFRVGDVKYAPREFNRKVPKHDAHISLQQGEGQEAHNETVLR